MSVDRLTAALTAVTVFKTPARMAKAIGRRDDLRQAWHSMDHAMRSDIQDQAAVLADRGVQVMFHSDDDYPPGLQRRGRPTAPVLFFLGDRRHFSSRGVGMCGSRHVSDIGLKAAHACGVEVSRQGLTVVSGYAKGVDTATHLAALEGQGRTTIVLAEGINHFRVKSEFKGVFDRDRVLVVSQFPPSQPWRAYAAMARNDVIIDLSEVLVVVEAGEKGGTRAAGESALSSRQPVVVLDFGPETPPGNKHLLALGADAVTSVADLSNKLRGLGHAQSTEPQLW